MTCSTLPQWPVQSFRLTNNGPCHQRISSLPFDKYCHRTHLILRFVTPTDVNEMTEAEVTRLLHIDTVEPPN